MSHQETHLADFLLLWKFSQEYSFSWNIGICIKNQNEKVPILLGTMEEQDV